MKTPIGCAFASFLIMSCAGTSPNVSTTRLTSTTYITADAAATRLTQARCDREAACNRVGPRHDFTDRDECLRELGRDSHEHLRPDLCSEGVDEWRLVECLGDISAKRCTNPLDDLDEIPNCVRGEMCLVRVLPAREPASPF